MRAMRSSVVEADAFVVDVQRIGDTAFELVRLPCELLRGAGKPARQFRLLLGARVDQMRVDWHASRADWGEVFHLGLLPSHAPRREELKSGMVVNSQSRKYRLQPG